MERKERGVLFQDGASPSDNTASVRDKKNMRMEHWWNITDRKIAVFLNFSRPLQINLGIVP
jgi:hypothetical protein